MKQKWELENGEREDKGYNCACHEGGTSVGQQTCTLQDKPSLPIGPVCEFTKRLMVISSTKFHYRGPLLFSKHHYGSGSKNGDEENLFHQTAMT